MSTKFTGFHHGIHNVWTNTSMTMETIVIFSRDICITDVSYVGFSAGAHFLIAEEGTRRVLAHARTPRGDVKTRLTVVGGARLVLRGGQRYIFSRWHDGAGDIGWGNGLPVYPQPVGNGITVTFEIAQGLVGSILPASSYTVLPPRNHGQTGEAGRGNYSVIPYFWWEEVVNSPDISTAVHVPTIGQVGRISTISWTPIPLPAQPSGVTLSDLNVYYEVDIYNGSSWSNIASRITATSLSVSIPPMADTPNAQFRVRAFIEAYGARFYGGFRYSANVLIRNNQRPSDPLPFTFPVASSVLTIGRSYRIAWGSSHDPDGDPVTYNLDYFNGSVWTPVLTNSSVTNRTFHVPDGPETSRARFRVSSYDGKEYSAVHPPSSEFTVMRNVVPNTPRPFISPKPDEMRYLNQSYRIEWGAVDNAEQRDDIRYEVQFRPRLIDAWQTIREVNHAEASRTFMTHSISNVQDSTNPQYRVRAYDGLDYGDWTESSFFKITGNRVTNTRGFNEELKLRYAVNQELRLTWSAGSTVRGSQVLYDFEVFDGFTWRESMYDMVDTNIIFRIPKMSDTSNARFRIRSKTRYDFGGFVYSEWLETRAFTVINFFRYDNIVLPYPNDVQKKENVDYLRQLVNEMRTINELPPVVFTDEIIVRYDTVIKYIHFDEIERGILDCYEAHPNGRFNNARTETELRLVKLYGHQQELLMDLPQRLANILRALMNI